MLFSGLDKITRESAPLTLEFGLILGGFSAAENDTTVVR